ncbi:hypothetical protein U1Q18_015522 [Sarracenia purpurea var. burkii]
MGANEFVLVRGAFEFDDFDGDLPITYDEMHPGDLEEEKGSVIEIEGEIWPMAWDVERRPIINERVGIPYKGKRKESNVTCSQLSCGILMNGQTYEVHQLRWSDVGKCSPKEALGDKDDLILFGYNVGMSRARVLSDSPLWKKLSPAP